MISSGSVFAKQLQLHTGSMSNILMRTDGFKKVVKGLSYKRNSSTNMRSSQNVHSSMGKRTLIKQYEMNRQNDVHKQSDFYDVEKSCQFRRTKTAQFTRSNNHKKAPYQDRKKQFIQQEKNQQESFKNVLNKLGI